MDLLRDKLITPPVVTLPRLAGQCTTETDACDTKVGYVSLQEQKAKFYSVLATG